jgi:hypothetical protein
MNREDHCLAARGISLLGRQAERLLAPLCLVTAVSCALAIGSFGAWMTAAGPTDIRGIESNVLFTIQKNLSGQALYTDTSGLPYDLAQYGPLYYVISVAALKSLQIGPADTYWVAAVSRGVSLVFAVLFAWTMYWLQANALRIPHRMAIVATAFAFAACSPWLFLARPDSLTYLMTACSFGALMRIEGSVGARRTFWLCFSALCALGAMAAKQNGVMVIAVLLTTLLLSGRLRDFWTAGAIALIGGAGMALLAHLQWPDIWGNVIDGLNNGISIDNVMRKTYALALSNFALPLAMGLIIAFRWAASWSADRNLPRLALVIAVPLTLVGGAVTGLKEGSAENYFNDALIYATIAISLFLSSKIDEPMLRQCVAGFILMFLPFWTAHQLYFYYWLNVEPKESFVQPIRSFASRDYQSVEEFVRKELAAHPDALVISWEKPVNNYLPEYCVLPQLEVAKLMHDRGLIDPSALEQAVRQGRIKYAVYSAPRQPVRPGRVRFAVRRENHREIPTKVLGVHLPPAQIVHESGPLRVYEFRTRSQ